VALAGEDVGEPLADQRVVVDHQDPGRRPRLRRTAPEPPQAGAGRAVHPHDLPGAAPPNVLQRALRARGRRTERRHVGEDRGQGAVLPDRVGAGGVGGARGPLARLLVEADELARHHPHVVITRDEGVHALRDGRIVGRDLGGQLGLGEVARVGAAREVAPPQQLEPLRGDEPVAPVVVVDHDEAPARHRLQRAAPEPEDQVGPVQLVLHRPERIPGPHLADRDAEAAADAADLGALLARHVVGEDEGPAGVRGDGGAGLEAIQVDAVAHDRDLALGHRVAPHQVVAGLLAHRDVAGDAERGRERLLLPGQDPVAGEEHGAVGIAGAGEERLVAMVGVDDVDVVGRGAQVAGHRDPGRGQALRHRSEPRAEADDLVADSPQLDRQRVDERLGAGVVVEVVVRDEDLHGRERGAVE
jgi:hypothetical protein